jgi:hypothetical protein
VRVCEATKTRAAIAWLRTQPAGTERLLFEREDELGRLSCGRSSGSRRRPDGSSRPRGEGTGVATLSQRLTPGARLHPDDAHTVSAGSFLELLRIRLVGVDPFASIDTVVLGARA